MSAREALMLAAVHRYAEATAKDETPRGHVDEVMILLGAQALDQARAVVAEIYPSRELFDDLEQVAKQLGLEIEVRG